MCIVYCMCVVHCVLNVCVVCCVLYVLCALRVTYFFQTNELLSAVEVNQPPFVPLDWFMSKHWAELQPFQVSSSFNGQNLMFVYLKKN